MNASIYTRGRLKTIWSCLNWVLGVLGVLRLVLCTIELIFWWVFFHRLYITYHLFYEDRCVTLSSQEPMDRFQPHLAQHIDGLQRFKCDQMEDHDIFRGGMVEKLTTFKNVCHHNLKKERSLNWIILYLNKVVSTSTKEHFSHAWLKSTKWLCWRKVFKVTDCLSNGACSR